MVAGATAVKLVAGAAWASWRDRRARPGWSSRFPVLQVAGALAALAGACRIGTGPPRRRSPSGAAPT